MISIDREETITDGSCWRDRRLVSDEIIAMMRRKRGTTLVSNAPVMSLTGIVHFLSILSNIVS